MLSLLDDPHRTRVQIPGPRRSPPARMTSDAKAVRRPPLLPSSDRGGRRGSPDRPALAGQGGDGQVSDRNRSRPRRRFWRTASSRAAVCRSATRRQGLEQYRPPGPFAWSWSRPCPRRFPGSGSSISGGTSKRVWQNRHDQNTGWDGMLFTGLLRPQDAADHRLDPTWGQVSVAGACVAPPCRVSDRR